MANLLAHVTGEPHAENSTILHWITSNKPLLAVAIIGLTFVIGTVLLTYRTKPKDK